MNDLISMFPNIHSTFVIVYADDVMLLGIGIDEKTVIDNLKRDVKILQECGLNCPGMYAHFISRVAGPTYCKLLDLSVHDKLQPEFVLSMFVMTFLNILIDIP